jgi:hypothetical protein
MRNVLKAAAIGTIACGYAGIGPVAGADIPSPQAQVQLPPPDYYASPPVEEGYVYPPPAAYGYPQRPPTSYYGYGAPPVMVMPRPYYWGRQYGPIYGDRAYALRSYGRYAARGYGRYDHQWGRGYRGW